MGTIQTEGLSQSVLNKAIPFVNEMLAQHSSNIHSFTLVGSSVTPDYHEKLSDVNSVVVVNDIDLKFISFLAPLGKRYGKKGIAAPLVMTPHYIRSSLDAFPVEFLDFKLIHKTVYGEDIFKDLQIARPHLRVQCEREMKIRLMGLRQGYLSSLGKRAHLAAVLARSVTGSMPLFRAIIHLLGKEPPVPRPEVVKALRGATGIETDVFEHMLALKARLIKPSEHELRLMFERCYRAMEAVGKIVDELHA